MSQEMILEAIKELPTQAEIKSAIEPVSAEIVELKAANDELKTRLRDVEAKASAEVRGPVVEAKSIGEQFIDSDEFKSIREGKSNSASMEIKTVTNASALTWDQRLPGIVTAPKESLSILDALPAAPASSHTLTYQREVLDNGNADFRLDELADFNETDYTFDEQTLKLESVGHYVELTEVMMEDNTFVSGWINSRLVQQVKEKIQREIVNGTGTGGKPKGLVHADNHVVFTPEAGDSSIESIRKAMAQAEAANYNPRVLVMHPLDAAAFDLAKGSDGHFVAASVRDSNGARIWGLPIVKSTGIAQGSFMLIDTDYVSVVYRNALEVESSNSNGTNFISDKTTVKARQRVGLMVTRKEGVIYGPLVAAA